MEDEREDAPLPPELAALLPVAGAADAQLIDAAQPVVPGEPTPEEKTATMGANLGSMLQMGVLMVSPAMPFLPQCYTPETCERIGAAVAAVAEKRGWQLDQLATPEVALAVVAIPPTVQAVLLGKQYFEAKRREAEAAQNAAKVLADRYPQQAANDEAPRIIIAAA